MRLRFWRTSPTAPTRAETVPLPHRCAFAVQEAAVCTRCSRVQQRSDRRWCRVCFQGHVIPLAAWAALQPAAPTPRQYAAALAANAGLYLTGRETTADRRRTPPPDSDAP
jgi:hypothetical protein